MEPIRYTDVFFDNLKAYRDGKRYIINQGSARSSKTYSILQLLYLIGKKKQPRTISVVSQTLPHLKRGAIRDFLSELIKTGQYDDKSWNRSSLTYTVNNSTIEFFSVDQPDKIYGAARDILFCNEVNSISEEAFRQLAIRTVDKIFVDYNPTHEFYITDDYMKRGNAAYIHSTFLKNPYLSKEIIKELIEAGKRNANFQKVFVEGEVGLLEGVVFTDWEFGEFNNDLPLMCFGQDYGWSNDPTTLIKVAIDKQKRLLYVDECFYLPSSKLSTQQIYELNKIHANDKPIIADNAEGRLIEELKGKGLNIRPCKKTTIQSGLMHLLNYKIIISGRSHNIEKELRNYIWLDSVSKMAIDRYNHAIDSIRYAVEFLDKLENYGKYTYF